MRAHPIRRARQRGMTLVIGLIMLVMISLAAVATYQMSKTGLEIVGNMQFENEAVASANAAIQEALSTTRLYESPNTLFLQPCGQQNRLCYDLTGDTQPDLTVDVVPPSCVRARILIAEDLDLDTLNPDTNLPVDFGCLSGDQQTTWAIGGVPTGLTLCAESIWTIEARAAEIVSNANVTVTMGAQILVHRNAVDTSCPT